MAEAEKSVVTVAEPEGVISVPGLVSITLTMHADCPFSVSGLGSHVTLVDVERGLTPRLKVPRLVPWLGSTR